MFQRQILPTIAEVSHKQIEVPTQSVYFNHIHNHCEILLFISGAAEYNIDGKLFHPRPFDLLFIPSATYHYLIPSPSQPYENYVIGFEPTLLEREHYDRLFSEPLMIGIQDDEELLGFFKRLDAYAAQYTSEDFAVCTNALIRELLIYCSYRKSQLQSQSSTNRALIEEIVSYISAHITEPLCAEEIARHFLLSKSYVQNLFCQTMHIGLKKFIMQKKIYAAHAEIRGGSSPSDACQKYGFGDYSSFYRLYKKTFSASPRKRDTFSKND